MNIFGYIVYRMIHTFPRAFKGWLYHMELIPRPRQMFVIPEIQPDSIFWFMLNESGLSDWEWYLNRPF